MFTNGVQVRLVWLMEEESSREVAHLSVLRIDEPPDTDNVTVSDKFD